VQPELFLVGLIGDKIVATAMGGYDGHRGWIYYLGVDPAYQRRSLGQQIMAAIEEKLLEMGCPKVKLQVSKGNLGVVSFYEKIGFEMDEVVEMGKRLIND